MKTKLCNYLKDGILNDETMAKIINAYEEWRCAEAEESVFDLNDSFDFDSFAFMYGNISAERCKKETRFWLGGNNFYLNEDDKTISRSNKVRPILTGEVPILAYILDEMEDLYDTFLGSHTNNETEFAISVANQAFFNYIDFDRYTKDNYPSRFKKNNTFDVTFNVKVSVETDINKDSDNLNDEEMAKIVALAVKKIRENPNAYISMDNWDTIDDNVLA